MAKRDRGLSQSHSIDEAAVRHRMKIKACEQIGPEIGHSLSVSPILR